MGRASGQYAQAASPDAVSPVLLLRVLEMPSISNPEEKTSGYFADSEEFLSFFDEAGTPEAYLPVGLSFDKVSCDNGNKVVSFVLKLDNVSRDFCALASQVQIKGCRVELLSAFREDLSDPEAAQTIMAGSIQGWSITEYSIEADVTAPLNLPMRTPQRLYWPRCHWRFGGQECSYWGTPGTTDLSTQGNAISGGYESSSYTPAKAFDDSLSSKWSSSQTGSNVSGNAYIGQTGLLQKIRKITLKNDDTSDDIVSAVKVQWREGGGAWQDVASFSLDTGTNVVNTLFLPDYGATGTHDIRILADANPSDRWQVFEVEMFGISEVATTCDKTFETCKAYANSPRFGGFPHILRTRNPREVWTKV